MRGAIRACASTMACQSGGVNVTVIAGVVELMCQISRASRPSFSTASFSECTHIVALWHSGGSYSGLQPIWLGN
jgi:hypothetical protein